MLVLGRNHRFGDDRYPEYRVENVLLSDDARKQGMYVIGTTGTGKSTFLLNMICQDMRRRTHFGYEGLCVLDPHGDFTYDILARVPPDRRDDVILFDPSDIEYPFGLNLFECDRRDPRARDLVVSTIIDTLKKLFMDSWGPRMEDLLRHGILSLLLHNEPTTLIHLMMLMVSYEHRQRLTKRAKELDPILRFYWEDEFPESQKQGDGYRRPREQIELVSSSLNKIGRFITNPIIRNIVGQPESTINLRKVMDEGKILLVNLSKGDLGQDNASLLGAVLVNQLLISALSRREIPEGERRPFHLYVDEYQTFATKAFPQLQSEARKYAIDTVVAHQFRDQLDDENKGSSLNVANVVSFRVSGKDAEELAPQFDLTPPEADPKYEPIYQLARENTNVFYQPKTEGTTSGLFRLVEGEPQPYSDVKLETANMLAQLPNYQAICRVLTAKDKPRTLHQFRIDLMEKPQVSEKYANQSINEIIEASRRRCRFTRREIEEYIAKYTKGSVGEAGIPIFDDH